MADIKKNEEDSNDLDKLYEKAQILNLDLTQKHSPEFYDFFKSKFNIKEFIKAEKEAFKQRPEKLKLAWEKFERKMMEDAEKKFNNK